MGRPKSCETLSACDDEILALQKKLETVRAKKRKLESEDNQRMGSLFRSIFGDVLPDTKDGRKDFVSELRVLYDQAHPADEIDIASNEDAATVEDKGVLADKSEAETQNMSESKVEPESEVAATKEEDSKDKDSKEKDLDDGSDDTKYPEPDSDPQVTVDTAMKDAGSRSDGDTGVNSKEISNESPKENSEISQENV